MDMLIIEGGHKLSGEVEISGSKNAALPILIASLLCENASELNNVPKLADTMFLRELLTSLGVECSPLENNCLLINPKNIKSYIAHYDVVRKMRASVLVLAPLLTRFGKAQVSLPGGCAIGARPVDIHLKSLIKMGAEVEVSDGYIYASLPKNRFFGANIDLPIPSVGATEQIIMAGVLAQGITRIKNAAKEPEIIELVDILNDAGAKIAGQGTSEIIIHGVSSISGFKHKIGPDRIEAGTFIALAAATNSNLLIKKAKLSDLTAVIDHFCNAGCEFEKDSSDNLLVKPPEKLLATNMETQCHPGFPTDLQAQFMAAMCVANGESKIYERIFDNRMMHVPELRRLGANIKLEKNMAIVSGTESLSGAPVMATDLRASASLVIAALCSKGKTEIRRIYHLDRGYELLDDKLIKLDAKITRAKQN